MRRLGVGFACNNACVFCAQGELGAAAGRGAGLAPPGLDQIAAGETVAFLGGEPTLHDDLPAWIRAADARGAARIILQTNGRRLAYRAYARALAEASAKLVLDVSLPGSSAAMHDYHTGVVGSFAQTVQGLRNARLAGLPAGVTTVITRSNFRHLAEIVRVAHAASAAAIHLVEARAFGRAARDHARVIPAAEMVAPHLARAVADAQRLGLAVVVGDRAQTPLAASFFAGLGEVEPPVEAPVDPAAERKKVILPLASPHSAPEKEQA